MAFDAEMGDCPSGGMGLFSKFFKKAGKRGPSSSTAELTTSGEEGGEVINVEDFLFNEVPIGRMTYGYRSFSRHSWVGLESIGRFCSIAKSCSIVGASHPLEWVSTNPFLYNKDRGVLAKKAPRLPDLSARNRKVTIGHDVWVGEGVRILRSVTLGHGCVVGAGSVVTKSVPPYAIVVGVPAKVMRYRIPEELIPDMLEIAWWDWPLETIKERMSAFYDPAEFVKTFKRSGAAIEAAR